MIQSTNLLEYQADLFVNRKKEVDEVMARIHRKIVQSHNYSEPRTLIIQGEHGMGKSWLLAHLFHRLEKEKRTSQMLINLDEYRHIKVPEEAVEAIWYKLYQLLLNRNYELPIDLDRLHRYMLQEFRKNLLSQRPLVLLIDSVYEAEWELLKVLERYLLAPMIVQQGVLLIMAGRGKPYPWSALELRLRAHFFNLESFDAADTASQLACQIAGMPESASQIYAMGKGNPKATYILGQTDCDPAMLNQYIDDLLSYLPATESTEIRQTAEALSIPNQFDNTLAAPLLNEHIPPQYARERKEIVDMIDRLVVAGLVYWNTDLRSFTFYDSTRHLLRQYMHHNCPQKSIQLHKIAKQFYENWIAKRPSSWERWQPQVEHHQQCLAQLQHFTNR